MECEHCHERPATLHFTQYAHGKKHVQHLCHTCAHDLGLIEANDHYPIHDLLSDLFKMNSALSNSQRQTSARETKTCPTCQMTYTQFVKHYKFGCKDCYETFSAELEPVLKRYITVIPLMLVKYPNTNTLTYQNFNKSKCIVNK